MRGEGVKFTYQQITFLRTILTDEINRLDDEIRKCEADEINFFRYKQIEAKEILQKIDSEEF